MAGEKFSIQSIIEIDATAIKPIIAPSYRFYPETKEQDKIQEAMKMYGVQPLERPLNIDVIGRQNVLLLQSFMHFLAWIRE